MELKNRIGGEQVATRATLDNINPADGTVIGTVPRTSAQEAEQALAAADAAAPVWGETPPSQRAQVLARAADLIEARLDEFARAETRDTGKPLSTSSSIDIPRAVANFRFFAGALGQMTTGFTQMDGGINYTLRQPVGTAALITPWNLPLYLLTWKTAPALAMGNAVVAKPSELTPTTATMLADVLQEAGLPDGAFNVVHGLGPEVGQAIVADPRTQAVSFTGGTATGARVAATAAPLFKKLSLELGGKNPTVVFDDCDFDKAVLGAVRAGFTNTGQICLCGSRLLVQKSIADRFVEAFVRAVEALPQGDPLDPRNRLGPVVSAAHRDKVASYAQLALDEEGTLLTGGGAPDLPAPFDQGFFLRPTVAAGLPFDCRTATEEVFGPFVSVHTFADEDEAVAMANHVRYGLAASVWTQDLGRAHRVSARIETGMVWVNTWLQRDLRVAFGGVKDSGVGREGGDRSLSFFSQDKNVCIATGLRT